LDRPDQAGRLGRRTRRVSRSIVALPPQTPPASASLRHPPEGGTFQLLSRCCSASFGTRLSNVPLRGGTAPDASPEQGGVAAVRDLAGAGLSAADTPRLRFATAPRRRRDISIVESVLFGQLRHPPLECPPSRGDSSGRESGAGGCSGGSGFRGCCGPAVPYRRRHPPPPLRSGTPLEGGHVPPLAGGATRAGVRLVTPTYLPSARNSLP
jgi:hypothetical protein